MGRVTKEIRKTVFGYCCVHSFDRFLVRVGYALSYDTQHECSSACGLWFRTSQHIRVVPLNLCKLMFPLLNVQAYIIRLLTLLCACSGSNRESVEPAMLEVCFGCLPCTSCCCAMSCTHQCINCQHTLPACLNSSPAWAALRRHTLCAVSYAAMSAAMSSGRSAVLLLLCS